MTQVPMTGAKECAESRDLGCSFVQWSPVTKCLIAADGVCIMVQVGSGLCRGPHADANEGRCGRRPHLRFWNVIVI